MANSVLVETFKPLPFPTNEAWDANLSKDQHRRLRWQDKQIRSQTALVRKVTLLQALAGSLAGVLAEPLIPQDRKALREWHDPSRGLWRWEDVKLDNPNLRNGPVIKAFFDSIAEIDELKKGRHSTLRRKLLDRNAIIERLELRNAELLEINSNLRAQIWQLETKSGD